MITIFATAIIADDEEEIVTIPEIKIKNIDGKIKTIVLPICFLKGELIDQQKECHNIIDEIFNVVNKKRA